MQSNYVGRFAPSPTGPLHYGSLLAAVASYLQAKHNHGQWLLRIDDIDPPREVAGAATDIRSTLEYFQFEWDKEPLYQSTRFDAYRAEIKKLIQQDQVYACSCSRKDLENNLHKSELGPFYPRICANKKLDVNDKNLNLRMHIADGTIVFRDAHYGNISHNLFKEIGDIVIYRKFDLPSYSLAVTIDDAFQGITEVVRGNDLLAFTPVQLYLCKLLQLRVPNFLHIPIIVNQENQKLSKQTGATALDKQHATSILVNALRDLGQDPPADIDQASIEEIWNWAIPNWSVDNIPKRQHIQQI